MLSHAVRHSGWGSLSAPPDSWNRFPLFSLHLCKLSLSVGFQPDQLHIPKWPLVEPSTLEESDTVVLVIQIVLPILNKKRH